MTFQRGNRKAGKLTGEQVYEIRQKYSMPGYTQAALAREYEVSVNTIANIVNWLSWQHTGYEPPGPRPPLEPRVGANAAEESFVKLQARLANAAEFEPKALVDQESTGIGMSRLQQEIEKLNQGVEQRVEDGLDKLEKGD